MLKIDAWPGPPEQWRIVACQRCAAEMRVPLPPSDGLCDACRDGDRRSGPPTVEQRLADAGAPARYAGLTRATWERRFGGWREHSQFSRLLGWPEQHPPSSWLVFIFSPGYGDRKTGLATAVFGEALARGHRGCWTCQSTWLREIRESWNHERRTETESDIWRRAADAGILLFDDLGGIEGQVGSDKPWWRVQVTQLLHYRESHRLPTLVTANLASWRQVGRIHQSLVSRMDVTLKIALKSGRDYRAESHRDGQR